MGLRALLRMHYKLALRVDLLAQIEKYKFLKCLARRLLKFAQGHQGVPNQTHTEF